MEQERLIRVSEVSEILGVCKATVWNWLHNKPEFPKPKKLSKTVTVWKLSEINTFIDDQIFA